MEKEILRTIKYFSFFDYPPSFGQIYTFFPKRCPRKKLKEELEKLVKKEKLLTFDSRFLLPSQNTMGGQGIKLKIKNEKLKIKNIKNQIKDQISRFKKRYFASQKKLRDFWFKLYLRLLSFFPQIKLAGLSGSIAMMNADEDDDIDLFIITGKNRLFTGRFIAVFLAKIFGLYKNKVCLNLFFDEKNLAVPDFKKTEYVAHEILQMKPVLAKGDIYPRFLAANCWVFKIFPNAYIKNSKFKIQISKLQSEIKNNFLLLIFNLIADTVERILKSVQLYFINRHRTKEIILEDQLWFHPKDFNQKIGRNLRSLQ